MASKGQEAAQRILAIIVIMAMLMMIGIPLTVIFFFGTVVYFVWRAVQRSEQQDIKNVFDFYISANDILREDEKRWYGFEIDAAIKEGEGVLQMMSDPPPLVYFALGALYHRAGEHEVASEHLSYVVEGEQGEESRRLSASPELRRYVQVLRRIEREPAEAPMTIAAMRGLERLRRLRAEAMLADSRARLKEPDRPTLAAASFPQKDSVTGLGHLTASPHASAHAPSVPPPIAEVLRDLYEEEKKTA
jgi:hypothetical protein